MKQTISLWENAGYILDALTKGVLLTTAADGKCNTMTIGWGTLGHQWRKDIFIAFVRQSRFTRELLDKNPEFTVNIPWGSFDRSLLSLCGTCSGRDRDKFSAFGLTAEKSETLSVPGIRQFPLTLECKVVYRQVQDPAAIDPESFERYYSDPEGDYHIAYYGQITGAYLIV